MSPLMDDDDLCKRWGCSPRTLERYRSQGLVCIRIGSGPKYRIEDVEAFEDKRSTGKKRRRRSVQVMDELPTFKHLDIK